MTFERDERRYELLKGSDVGNDTVYLELNDITEGESKTVLFGEKSGDGKYRLLSVENPGSPIHRPLLLPLDLVEDFISWMKERL
jgi:hypothetical protein